MAVINGVDYNLQSRTIPEDGLLVSLSEHFDEFLLDWQMKHPQVWRDRIPLGQFPLFNGYSQKSYIFRGTLGPQAGLTDWAAIEPSRKAASDDNGYDRCSYNPQTYTWAYDAIDFAGLQTSWRSPVFCVNDLKFQDKAQQQLGMIIKAGAMITDQIKETFNRESYVKAAADAGKFFVLAEGVGLDFIDASSARVTYNPYSATTITFSSTMLGKISTLNFSILDLLHQYLSDQCPDSAIGNEGGLPVYGLMLDLKDFEKYVLTDADLREDFRFARPQPLISGFNMGFKTYRGWALIHDPRQMRFTVSTYGTTVTASRVLPRRATRDGIIGHVPEANPAYVTAELGTAIVFLNNVIQILIPAPVNSLGSGMSFGPAPDFSGQWAWLNILDPETNPLGENGYFFSRYEYFVKSLEYAQDAMVFLYRRCTQSLATKCEVEDLDRAATSATVAAAAATGDFSTTTRLVTVTLDKVLDCSVGRAVTVTHGGGATPMVVTADSEAPTYTFGWLSGADNAPTVYTQFTTSTTVAVV